MQPLVDKYKPQTLDDLIGVPRARAILGRPMYWERAALEPALAELRA